MSLERYLIKVNGTVQGVGFRPYVYGLATECGLKGSVSNTSEGVTIEVEGTDLEGFVSRLREETPPLARITNMEVSALPPLGYSEFRIVESEDRGSFTLVSPDVSTCGDCLSEISDPGDRRYGYPFTNCTNCGPRYTITLKVPYDRPNTTMSVFTMCRSCGEEYKDPANRRFHAVPNACPSCGPSVSLLKGGRKVDCPDPVAEAVNLLRQGMVVAVKGLGGFHLACDATNTEAVERLRREKRKNHKPFALMAPDMAAIKRYCHVSEYEEAFLESNRRPVVLLKKKAPCRLPEDIAPGSKKLGFMLPYTPLHYLLFRSGDDGAGGLAALSGPLVMTSGNLSEEPIQKDNDEAARVLEGLADAFLTHDRDIFMRVDDSVLKLLSDGTPAFIRRSRGYAPEPVMLQEDGPDVLGAGADLKNTFTLLKGPYAICSQHIGDMENYETLGFYEETFRNLTSTYRAEPVAIAHDLHPGYLSTRWALRQPWKKLGVQHHHAHIASVMAGHGLKQKVIGVALDGTGYGTDGTLWGGEFLIADALGFERAGHFGYMPLPGGERAVREPWRTAVSLIRLASGSDATGYLKSIGFYERFGQGKVEDVLRVAGIKEVSPLSSGAGRLFDAVSSILGICDVNTFEGEAAIALESAASTEAHEDYPVNIKFDRTMVLDFSYTIICIISDMLSGTGRDVASAKFHNTVAEAVRRVVEKLSSVYGLRDVVLSGGVFQNDYLLERTRVMLREDGFEVYINRHVPANDAGVSLGQAYILRESLKAGWTEGGI